MIQYSALTQDLALQNKNLTTLPEFMSNMFTALIYIYTCKLSHDQCIKKEFGTYINSSKCPCNLKHNTVKNDDSTPMLT